MQNERVVFTYDALGVGVAEQSSENQTDGIRRKINWIVAVVRLWMA